MYLNGSIGMAKQNLYDTTARIRGAFPDVKAYISVNKALVTQSSAAIPIVPLYISILYKVMKEKGLHEGCIEQMDRLFRDRLYANPLLTDTEGRIRVDDYEMQQDVQSAVTALWEKVADDNLSETCDIKGYWEDFFEMFGFGFDNVDYSADVDPAVSIPSLES